MREMRLTPTNNNISFAQLLGMRDHIAFPLGKNVKTETAISLFEEIFITDCIGRCHFDNSQCSQ